MSKAPDKEKVERGKGKGAASPECEVASVKCGEVMDARKRVGRPSSYSPELADEICARIAGAESMRRVCEDEAMPDRVTVFRWLRTHDEFRNQYARAKEESADAMMEEILDIADDGTNDWMEVFDKDGESVGWKLNGEHVQRSKLRIDSRKWLMSKMKPKKYGEKLEVESTAKAEMVLADDVQDKLVEAMKHAAAVEAPGVLGSGEEE